jgi:hypothetical protein
MGFYKKEITAEVRQDVRMTAADKAEIQLRAGRACLSVSEYIRRCALGKRVDMHYDADVILALSEVSASVRALLASPATNLTKDDVQDVLQKVVLAIERV